MDSGGGTDTSPAVAADVSVREATLEELPAVLNVLDGAALATDSGRLRSALDAGDVLVAVAATREHAAADSDDTDSETDHSERILGVLVLRGEEITAVAVRRRRRAQGIGTSLVRAALERRDRLVAEFDPGVRPFWADVGFVIEPADDPGRYRGVRYREYTG